MAGVFCKETETTHAEVGGFYSPQEKVCDKPTVGATGRCQAHQIRQVWP